jgi:hypothetical protein
LKDQFFVSCRRAKQVANFAHCHVALRCVSPGSEPKK